MREKSKNRIVKKKRKHNLHRNKKFWRVIPRDSCEVYRERMKRRLEENCSDKEDFNENETDPDDKKRKNKSRKTKVRFSRRRNRRRCSSSESTNCSSFCRSSVNTSDSSDVSKMDTD